MSALHFSRIHLFGDVNKLSLSIFRSFSNKRKLSRARTIEPVVLWKPEAASWNPLDIAGCLKANKFMPAMQLRV